MNTKLGRNAPCYCGSGKKYKKCHLPLDEQRAAAAAASAPPSPTPAPARGKAPASLGLSSPPHSLREMRDLVRQLAHQGSPKQQAEFKRILAETEPVLSYMERAEEIEAAAAALEPHRDEYRKLARNEQAFLERAEALFAEERFAPLRFTAAEVQRAFEHVDYSPSGRTNEETAQKLRAAILFLADPERRRSMAMELNLRLPELVGAGRHLDAWLVQDCAYRTGEDTGESNAFLFQMFSHGYEAWAREREEREEALLHEFGLDTARLRSMSLEEIDAWMREQTADPAKAARLERAFQVHPEQREQAIANIQQMERQCIELLERDDAQALLLSPNELQPWLPILNERWAHLLDKLSPPPGQAPPAKQLEDALLNTIWPTMGEMAKSIFTRERLQCLITQLKHYRSERFAAGDKGVAGWAQAALGLLERAKEPGENYFLRALCYHSLGRVTQRVAHPEADPAQDEK